MEEKLPKPRISTVSSSSAVGLGNRFREVTRPRGRSKESVMEVAPKNRVAIANETVGTVAPEAVGVQDRLLLGTALATSITEIENHQHTQSFGPSVLPAKHARGDQDGFRIPDDRMESRLMLRNKSPESPGIYGYFDRNGRLHYVGKSKCLKKRLLSYFSKTVPDPKMERIVAHSRFVRWEPISHELLALIREQELITRWRPCFNSQGQPQRRQPAFLCISDREAPHAVVTSRISAKNRHCFGPIAGSGRLREAAEDLNQVFRLRDCNEQTAMRFSDQLELFPSVHPPGCIRYEIGSCTGPCTGTFPQADYHRQVTKLSDFLNGYDCSILEVIESQMVNASERLAFENAAQLRNRLQNLRWLHRCLGDLRRSRYDLNCIFPVPGFKRRKVWLFLSSGLLSNMMAAPFSRRSAADVFQSINKADLANPLVLPHDSPAILMQLILIRWFRRYPQERSRLLSYPVARLECEKHFAPLR
jgi:excinuclease ABC subunit C